MFSVTLPVNAYFRPSRLLIPGPGAPPAVESDVLIYTAQFYSICDPESCSTSAQLVGRDKPGSFRVKRASRENAFPGWLAETLCLYPCQWHVTAKTPRDSP
jgi:hypothetical protein